MNFKTIHLAVIFGLILMQGAISENTINNIEITIDDYGLLHLKETILLTPTFDDNKRLKGEILIPKDAKGSLSIFYDLGKTEVPFESKPARDGELVTIFFPVSETPDYLFDWNAIPGADTGKLISFLEKDININWLKNAKIEKIDNGKTIMITRRDYLFNLNNIPGSDNKTLIEFLENVLAIDWAKNAEIRKSSDNKTIILTHQENLVTIKVNEEKNTVTIETDEGNSYEYALEKEDSASNVYKKGENAVRFYLKEDERNAVLEILKSEYKVKDDNLTLETIIESTGTYPLIKENKKLNIYEPVKSQVITLDYKTYQFTSRSGTLGLLNFSYPTTPDVTEIKIKFPEESSIIQPYISPDVASILISHGNELTIRPKAENFSQIFKYELNIPVQPKPGGDNESPIIILKTPVNNTSYAVHEQEEVTFTYSAEDVSGIKNCELIINDEAIKINEITTKDNEFSINLGEGTYIWTVRCTDNSTSENSASAPARTLTISKESRGLIDSILPALKSEYGISLILALILVTYLIIAYVKRSRKKKPKAKEPELEELYPEPEEEEQKPEAKEETGEINPSIMKLMDENEKKIINILKDGETTQANIYKITQIPKATLSDLMRKLEERNLIERRAEGRVKWVKLKDWVFE